MGAGGLQVMLCAEHSSSAQQCVAYRHAHGQETALLMEAVVFRTCIPCFLLIPSCFVGYFFLFFPGQQLTTHLNNTAYRNECMVGSKGCPTTNVNFEFTASSLEIKMGFYSTGIIRMQKFMQFQVGFTQFSMSFLPMGSCMYLER